MYNKQYITILKEENPNELAKLINENLANTENLLFILEALGKLPSTFSADWILDLCYHSNYKVRLWAVKTLGKINTNDLNILESIAINDNNTMVRREAVSSIGRQRNPDSIPFLLKILNDLDPKIVCQAIRALLVYKGNDDVDFTLNELRKHPNEMVLSIIEKEYNQNIDEAQKRNHCYTNPILENVTVNGDVLDVLKYVEDESFHLTFTSPPYYNARDYSIYQSYNEYLEFLNTVFKEVLRTTKEGRFLIVNTSPVIVPRISRAHSSKRYPIPFDLHCYLTKMGWEFIDDIIWQKPEYSVKNRIGGFQQHRKPLAYKPNTTTEYLMVYRKHTSKLIDWNIKQYSIETVEQSKVADGFETTNVWQICPKSDKVHSAVFPEELCKRVVEYYSFVGDLVFDPFGGSGTLGRVARALNRKAFLTEKNPEYFEYIKSFENHNGKLFANTKTKFYTLEEFIKLYK